MNILLKAIESMNLQATYKLVKLAILDCADAGTEFEGEMGVKVDEESEYRSDEEIQMQEVVWKYYESPEPQSISDKGVVCQSELILLEAVGVVIGGRFIEGEMDEELI